ncbi:MAG: helix-turn-helix domain-containing protein [Pseudomonadota bacterium]
MFNTEPLEPFSTDSLTTHFGGISLLYADMTSQRWERDAAMLRSSEHDAMAISIGLTGVSKGRMGERSFRQESGDALVTDFSQVSVFEGSVGRTILLLVPREMASAAGLDVAEMHGLVLSSPAMQMLTSHALRIREALPELTEDDGARLARSVVDLLVIAVGASGRAEGSVTAANASTVLIRARAEIRQNLGSPALTVANLCRRLQISRSTLHRLFEEEGGVQAYIRNQRLDVVRQTLSEPGNEERIGAIADRLGFSDTAHLSRLFRERFGQSPSEWRAQGPDQA